jgi:membrane-associated phospholipid phosphatase
MVRGVTMSLVENALAVYRGRHVLWHIAAAGITAALVFSGIDWWFYTETRIAALVPIVYLAGIGGFFAPVLIPLALYLYGEIADSVRARTAGLAGAQAVIIAWCISSFYKALTGRIEPEFLTTLIAEDRSRTFNFGFLEYGIYWGWPSSHTAVACALVVAMVVILRGAPLARMTGAAYAGFVGFGAAVGFHWLSDVIAGAIIGSLVGLVVGRSFLARQRTTD